MQLRFVAVVVLAADAGDAKLRDVGGLPAVIRALCWKMVSRAVAVVLRFPLRLWVL